MSGDGGGGDEVVKMEDEESRGGGGECEVLMWGYLPGATSQRSPLLSPTIVNLPESISPGDSWKDVCGGGCGFAMATSESGKLITWGSTDDMGQSYVTTGKHGVVWCLIRFNSRKIQAASLNLHHQTHTKLPLIEVPSSQVHGKSVAAKAGLLPTTRGFAGNVVLGDVVVVDEKPVRGKVELSKVLDDYNVGDKVVLKIRSGNDDLELPLVLEATSS